VTEKGRKTMPRSLCHSDVPAAGAIGLVEAVRAGDQRALARLITLVENRSLDLAGDWPEPPSQGRSTVIGITGYPGAGKSTLVDRLVAAYRRRGRTVAVLAVDISSPRTGGALLGDRIRMQAHALDQGVFIRSMATRGHHGGLAAAVADAVPLLVTARYDVILIETIGVGQDECDVVTVADTVVALVAPGLGDEVQAMKAGLLEVADLIVLNKADLPGADAAMRDLSESFAAVHRTVATKDIGIEELVAAITTRVLATRSGS
jgi:LAO/AO transport system kinase